jgi:hypothetical protein
VHLPNQLFIHRKAASIHAFSDAFSDALPVAIASTLAASTLSLMLCHTTAASAQSVGLNVQPYHTADGIAQQILPQQALPQAALAKPALAQKIAANTTNAAPSVWNLVDVADGGFKVFLPGEIDRKVNLLQVDGKSVEQTLLLATQKKHDAFYMVAWSDLSVQESLSEADRIKILDSTKASFLRSFRGSLTEQIRFKLGGNSGMQYRMNSRVRGNPFTITSRSYVVGNRLYHVLAAIPKRVEPYLTGSTVGFLRSFQLRPIEPGPVQVSVGSREF